MMQASFRELNWRLLGGAVSSRRCYLKEAFNAPSIALEISA